MRFLIQGGSEISYNATDFRIIAVIPQYGHVVEVQNNLTKEQAEEKLRKIKNVLKFQIMNSVAEIRSFRDYFKFLT